MEFKSLAAVTIKNQDPETDKCYIWIHLTEEENDKGFPIATIDEDGNVERMVDTYITLIGIYDLAPIEYFVKQAQLTQSVRKKELVRKCVYQFLSHLHSMDMESVEELLMFTPAKALKCYIPDSEHPKHNDEEEYGLDDI